MSRDYKFEFNSNKSTSNMNIGEDLKSCKWIGKKINLKTLFVEP